MLKLDSGSPHDDEKFVNGEDTAITIKGVLEDLRIDTIKGSMIAFGAGGAAAELSLAKKLEITDIKLVDKEFKEPVKGFSGETETAEMFQYLETRSEQRELVTAIGMEYVLNVRSNWVRFWTSVKNITKPGSIIIVYPHLKNELQNEAFEILDDGNVFIAKRIS